MTDHCAVPAAALRSVSCYSSNAAGRGRTITITISDPGGQCMVAVLPRESAAILATALQAGSRSRVDEGDAS